MEKLIVRYLRSNFVIMIVLSCLVFSVISMIFLMAAIGSHGIEKFVYILITVTSISLMVWAIFAFSLDLRTRIILTDEGLTFEMPFRKYRFRWDEITEFGKIKRGIGWALGGAVVQWAYYIKSHKSGAKKFFLGGAFLVDINKMCSTIFEKANKAKFVITQNVSWIPFVIKYESIKWERDEDSKESIS